VVADAGTDALSTFLPGSNGTLGESTPSGPVCSDVLGHVATRGVLTSNADGAKVSSFAEQLSPALLGATERMAGDRRCGALIRGAVSLRAGGGTGTVDEFQVGRRSLVGIGSVLVPGAAGGEGIVAF